MWVWVCVGAWVRGEGGRRRGWVGEGEVGGVCVWGGSWFLGIWF